MKEFFTFEQQLEKIKSKGIIVDDEEMTLQILRDEGYYNIVSGYCEYYRDKHKKMYKGTHFSHIESLYVFDNILKNIIYKYASKVECHIKAQVAHTFSEYHGVDEKRYLVPDCFSSAKTKQQNIRGIIAKCNKVINNGIDKKSPRFKEYLFHAVNSHGHIPFWVLARSLTFGCISTFFDVMKENERDIIANLYGIDKDILSNLLMLIVQFRNIVAHGERTFSIKLPQHSLSSKLKIYDKLQVQRNSAGDPMYGKKDLMALIIAFKYLLSKLEFNGFFVEFDSALSDFIRSNDGLPEIISHIKKEMGLVGSWRSICNIKLGANI